MVRKPEIYVSTDVETDGPIPGPHSMLCLASAAYLPDKTLIGTFSANLEPLPGAKPHPKTMKFWSRHPETFDFMFVYWYLIRFVGESPFGFVGLDIKTYAMAMLKQQEYRGCVKRKFPKRWFDPHPHTHVALDDAIEQGALFCNMLAENLGHDRET